MKKSVLIAACAMLVGSAFAGAVNWKCYEDAGLQPDQLAYLFAGDSSGVADAITGGTFDGSGSLASAVTDEYGEIEVFGIGSYGPGDEVTLYMVVFDKDTIGGSDNFIVSDPVTFTFGQSGNRVFDFSDSFASSTWDPISPTPPGPGPDPVPEPTSVALLALGLAAFGLKRKVA